MARQRHGDHRGLRRCYEKRLLFGLLLPLALEASELVFRSDIPDCDGWLMDLRNSGQNLSAVRSESHGVGAEIVGGLTCIARQVTQAFSANSVRNGDPRGLRADHHLSAIGAERHRNRIRRRVARGDVPVPADQAGVCLPENCLARRPFPSRSTSHPG